MARNRPFSLDGSANRSLSICCKCHPATKSEATEETTIELHSNAFPESGTIPNDYTCDGRDVSPDLHWSGIPSQAQALALIVDDPDAPGGTFTHWLLYDLPPAVTDLPAAAPASLTLDNGAKQGRNGFNKIGYGGPCPPGGPEHHYQFRLLALDRPLGIGPGRTRREIEQALAGHILAQGELIGRFGH